MWIQDNLKLFVLHVLCTLLHLFLILHAACSSKTCRAEAKTTMQVLGLTSGLTLGFIVTMVVHFLPEYIAMVTDAAHLT